jgi:tetratricopeptide (TPR) repeat protein
MLVWAAVALAAIPVSATDFESELQTATDEMTYFDFKKAYGLFDGVLRKTTEGSPEWQQAVFGKAVCAHQVAPASAAMIDEAVQLYQQLIDTTPDAPYAPRAMLNIGRVYELSDYYKDGEDFPKARAYYEQVVERWPDLPIAGEATLRIAGTYVKSFEPKQVRKGTQVLEDWLAEHPDDPLASAMWHYLAVTYFYPLENYAKYVSCMERADEIGLLLRGRLRLDYWRTAYVADTILTNRDVAVKFYTKVITETPTGGKAYEAQLALKRLGAPVPEISIFSTLGEAKGKAAEQPVTFPEAP